MALLSGMFGKPITSQPSAVRVAYVTDASDKQRPQAVLTRTQMLLSSLLSLATKIMCSIVFSHQSQVMTLELSLMAARVLSILPDYVTTTLFPDKISLTVC